MSGESLEVLVENHEKKSVMHKCIESYSKLVEKQEKMLLASKNDMKYGGLSVVTGFAAYELALYAEPISHNTKVAYEVISSVGLGIGIIGAIHVVGGVLGVYLLRHSVERLKFAISALKKFDNN